MGLLDKFMDVMRLNDDDDDYDYDEDYDDGDDYVEEPKSKPVRRERVSAKPKHESRSVDFEEEFIAPVKEEKPQRQTQQSRVSKVVPMRSRKNSGQVQPMEVCLIKPTSLEDEGEITETLLSGRAVILNMEGIHVELAQRILDFTSGSCYAINGNLRKISTYIFVVTPEAVELSGDFTDLFDTSLDITSM